MAEVRRSFSTQLKLEMLLSALGLQKQHSTVQYFISDQTLPFLISTSAILICNSTGAQSWHTEGPISPICEVFGRVLFMTMFRRVCKLVKKICCKISCKSYKY